MIYVLHTFSTSTNVMQGTQVPVVEDCLEEAVAHHRFEKYVALDRRSGAYPYAAIIITENSTHRILRQHGYPLDPEEVDLAITKHVLEFGT